MDAISTGFKFDEQSYRDWAAKNEKWAKIAGGTPRIRPEGQSIFEWLSEGIKNMTPEEKAEYDKMCKMIADIDI
jgi:hypothetical protein